MKKGTQGTLDSMFKKSDVNKTKVAKKASKTPKESKKEIE